MPLHSYENIYYGNKEPGELGFDPLRLGANPTSLAYYKASIPCAFKADPVLAYVTLS